MSIASILQKCNIDFTKFQPVHGGDINEAYCIQSIAKQYFLKVNNARTYPLMFEKEAKGLIELKERSRLIVPAVIEYGIDGDDQYLLLEWIDAGVLNKNSMKDFGRSLAEMHKTPQDYFGWKEDNYIGGLHQENSKENNWIDFYTNKRLLPLVKTLVDNGNLDKSDINTAEKFCCSLKDIFPMEPASLLHGDLWSGNYMVDGEGHAVIFDSAVYYGHREMDIGMSLLFGGFSNEFYQGYNECYPLVQGWKQRVKYTQLYPLLVHAVLFGGHYVSNCRSIINGLV